MKKKILIAFALLISSIPVFANCTDKTGIGQQRIMKALNGNISGASAQNAYNKIVDTYSRATGGSCDLSTIALKLEDYNQNLNNGITNNFNDPKSQIPLNMNNPYTGGPSTYTSSDGQTHVSNPVVDGLDHAGLVQMMIAKAGINTSATQELTLEQLSKMTKYQLTPGTQVGPGDVIIINEKNTGEVDTAGIVGWDSNKGKYVMAEMGGSSFKEGTSVKSGIPTSTATSTVYVVPKAEIMANLLSDDPNDPDPKKLDEIKGIMTQKGTSNYGIPVNNTANVEASAPRPDGPVTEMGYSEGTRMQNNVTEDNWKDYSKALSGATKELFEQFSKGTAKIAPVIIMIMTLTFSIQILWKIFRGGVLGDPEQIFNMIITEFTFKSPYFVFVTFYPLLMRYVIIPLCLYALPTYIFGDFVQVAHISISKGRFVTYLDLMAHIVKKGGPLVMASFGAQVTQQPATISSIWSMFATIWKTLFPVGGLDPVSMAMSLFSAYQTLTKIVYLVLQMVLFRPLSASVGIMVIITLLNIALNMFMCGLTFMLSTSVGIFYMICGTWDILQAKALNTVSIILSGMIQYLVMFAFVIVMGETIGVLGPKMAEVTTIVNPANFFALVKFYLLVSIIHSMCSQLGRNIATSF